MAERKYGFTLTGASPYLMHWDNLDGCDLLEAWRTVPENKKLSRAGDDRIPAWTWKHYTYNDGQHIALPSEVLGACLMKAATRVPTGNRARSGPQSFKTLIPCGVLFLDPFFEFYAGSNRIKWADIEAIPGDMNYSEHCAAAQQLGFRLFAKRARVGQSKHVRVRPRFDQWSVKGSFSVVEDTITDQVLNDVFRIAGVYVGIGDWRPSAPTSPGPFGRFQTVVKAA